jgi:hypothetical protein
MAFTKWHNLIVNWRNAPRSGNLDHQLTNELVNGGFTRDSLSFNTIPISMFPIDIVIELY